MTRQFNIAGQTMVQVYGAVDSTNGAISLVNGAQLGLSFDPIEIILNIKSEPLTLDAYGKDNPVDEQVFGGEATIIMNLIHFDPAILGEVVRRSYVSPAEGMLGTAGRRRGGGFTPTQDGFKFMILNMTSPVGNFSPYTFPSAYLKDEPYRYPIGAEKSVVRLVWRALAYSVDPWNAGSGSNAAILYTRTSPSPAPPNPT